MTKPSFWCIIWPIIGGERNGKQRKSLGDQIVRLLHHASTSRDFRTDEHNLSIRDQPSPRRNPHGSGHFLGSARQTRHLPMAASADQSPVVRAQQFLPRLHQRCSGVLFLKKTKHPVMAGCFEFIGFLLRSRKD